MKRKYLDDIRMKNRPDLWNENDKRQKKWEKERAKYGFDERDTWSMDLTFYCWLYEHLKMYLAKTSSIDLKAHTFKFKRKEYTQLEMINMMLERLEYYFSDDYNRFNKKAFKHISEIAEIWAKVLPVMWW